MNRINTLFDTKKENILSVYFTAGHPKPNTAASIIMELEKNGVDLIEIGIPFSDPLADGPVIQQSSQLALENGMTLKKLLSEIQDIRKSVKIPLILMGYFNTVLQFGVEEFCRQIAAIGIDGVILPDMPMEVHQESYQDIFESNGIIPVFLITPGTSDERIRKTDELSKGFIYMVSSASTTGTKSGFNEESMSYFKRINGMNLKQPVLTGFGISNKETFTQACEYSNGAIIGSAFIKALEQPGELAKNMEGFIKTLKG
ncbi:MAG: tryptophan synthase subunit alpha [Salinivirgaceae bacterium]|jgi:tryptophan synthase alpha chain